MNKKNVVAGLGEIGRPILKLLSKSVLVVGYDTDKKLMDEKKFNKYKNLKTEFLHVCIPFTNNFIQNVVSMHDKFKPECIVIHSTTSPNTTAKIQRLVPIPVIYSATRGIHKRMLNDLKRYTKFFAIETNAPNKKSAIRNYSKIMTKCNVKTKQMKNPLTLELAKIIVDTSYYGWLITYSQLSKMIAIQNHVDYDEMWTFADEIHKFLGNRPKMYPGFIGGHCVIPNLDLINNDALNLIKEINKDYAKILKNRNAQRKKTS